MGLLILPEYLRKQPVSQPLMNQASVLGRQRWAMINIPGVKLSGSANPVATAQSGAVYRYAKGGMSMVQTTNVTGGGFTFGTNAGLQLSTLSGVCVFSRDSAVSVPLFNTSYNGISGGGFIVWCENGSKIEIDKHDISLILQSSNSVLVHKPNAVAWSYNSGTGRTRIALNGILTAGTATSTLSHNTVSTLGYYSSTSAANTNPGSVSLLAISPDECFSDQALIDASINPWGVFAPPPKRFWFAGATSSPVTITCSVGNANTSGVSALLSVALTCAVGNANAAGVTATISAGSSVTITCSVGNASASGQSALVSTTVQCSVANAASAGVTALIQSGAIISASVGNAVASGITALLHWTLQTATGNATASGISAIVIIGGLSSSDPRYLVKRPALGHRAIATKRNFTTYAH